VGWPEATSGNGRPVGEEGNGADRRAPHGSDVREKVSLPDCAKSKTIHLSVNTPTRLGPSGPSGLSACVRRRPMGKAAGSDKFSGRIGQVLKWRKRTSSVAMKNGQVLKMDKFCSTGLGREGGGGPRLGWKKNKRGGRAEIKKKNF
jgi:hypothetical protein